MILRLGPIVIAIGGGDADRPPPEAYRAVIAMAVAKARARIVRRSNG